MHTVCSVASGYIACRPLDWRILHELHFACAATFRVPPAFDREWFHHLANGSQLHAFSQGRAFVYFVVHAHSIGDRRTETSSYVRKKKSLSFFLPPSLSFYLSLSLSLSLSFSLSLSLFFCFVFRLFLFLFLPLSFTKKEKKRKIINIPRELFVCASFVCEKRRKKKNTDGTASAFRKRLAFLALP